MLLQDGEMKQLKVFDEIKLPNEYWVVKFRMSHYFVSGMLFMDSIIMNLVFIWSYNFYMQVTLN